MNRNQFIEFIEHPENLNGKSIALLEGLVKEFPYFSTAHLLYAKNLHNENNIHYHIQLQYMNEQLQQMQLLFDMFQENIFQDEV